MRLLLCAILVFLSVQCFSQNYTKPVNTPAGPKWLANSAGTELKKASICYFTSLGCETLGIILVSEGAIQAANAQTNNTNNTTSTAGAGPTLLGSGLLITGAVFNILAWVHINHAGRLMESQKISFGNTKNGIGLTYNF